MTPFLLGAAVHVGSLRHAAQLYASEVVPGLSHAVLASGGSMYHSGGSVFLMVDLASTEPRVALGEGCTMNTEADSDAGLVATAVAALEHDLERRLAGHCERRRDRLMQFAFGHWPSVLRQRQGGQRRQRPRPSQDFSVARTVAELRAQIRTATTDADVAALSDATMQLASCSDLLASGWQVRDHARILQIVRAALQEGERARYRIVAKPPGLASARRSAAGAAATMEAPIEDFAEDGDETCVAKMVKTGRKHLSKQERKLARGTRYSLGGAPADAAGTSAVPMGHGEIAPAGAGATTGASTRGDHPT